MPIQTDKNISYGPPLVNQKYAPLAGIKFVKGDSATYSALLVNRSTWLRQASLLGGALTLATPGWGAVVAGEAGHRPPLVVISSNRSGWISKGIAAGNTQLASLGLQTFTGPADLSALTARAGQTVSPPIYMPERVNDHLRSVYVVVQMAEYDTYQQALAGTGITPVGWEFDTGGGGPAGMTMAGFGASRFAAMEFCKYLRRQAAAAAGGIAPWSQAWLVDDNVVALGTGGATGFAGLQAVEAALAANAARPCAGFQGGTSAKAQSDNKTFALNQIAAGRGGQAVALPPSNPPGIVQQMSLWNVAYLDQKFLDFGPVFVASAEDLSIVNYFNGIGTPYLFYGSITVLKEDTTYDNGAGAQVVNGYRRELQGWLARAEAQATPPKTKPPPPLTVQPTDKKDGGVQPLGTFIVERVLPKSLMHEQAGNVAVQDTAMVQAVEQITSGALNQKGFVTQAGIDAAFQVNGGHEQPINARDVP